MVLKLYKTDLSPPVRAVYLTAKALGLNLDLIEIDISLKVQDQLKPEFLKLNPQHTVPVLDDNGKIIWDSHAINTYLVTKYGKDDSLYPKDPYERAIVDQRLHFDTGVLFSLLRRQVRTIKYQGIKTIPQTFIDEGEEAYAFLEKFLEGHDWVAGEKMTLADFSLLTTSTNLDILLPINATKYPNITAWIKRLKQLPYYNVNQSGLEKSKKAIQAMLS